jgi:hypothetical protein
MAKSDFICKICKKVKGANFLSGKGKYKCPKHKDICGDHVTLFNGCRECSSKVMVYRFTGKRWEKV